MAHLNSEAGQAIPSFDLGNTQLLPIPAYDGLRMPDALGVPSRNPIAPGNGKRVVLFPRWPFSGINNSQIEFPIKIFRLYSIS
jgi:hypothetical protein